MQRLSSSAPLAGPAAALVVGIVLGDTWPTAVPWWGVLLTMMVIMLLLYRWSGLQSVSILLALAALGAVRSSSVRQQHEQVSWPDGKVRYEAVIASEVTEKPKTMGMDIVLTNNGSRLKCYVTKDDRSCQLQIGDRLQLSSTISRNSDWHFGSFDYRRYLEVHGFTGQTFVWADDWQRLPDSWQGLSLWQRARLRFLCYRHTLLQRYRQMGADGDEYAVLAAMTLGDKSAMTQDLRDVYAVSGASHVLALSGLHLGIIYMLLSLLVVRRRFRVVTQLLTVAAIWGFVLLVGLPASVVRSAVMISAYALVSLAGHRRMSLNALALAALCILMVNPDSLFDVGFQLSFAAMLAILLLLPLVDKQRIQRFLFDRPLLRWLWGLTTVSLAAQVGVAPLIAYYFGRFSTYFLLTNLIVIPAATAILCLALLALLLPATGVLLLQVTAWLNAALTLIASRLPFASIEGLHPSALQTAMVYVIIVSVYLIIIRYDKSV